MNTLKNKYRERIVGSLLGFAIGDAMGATTEFMDAKSIKKKYGKVKDIVGGGWLHLEPGEITDDTQMSMCVMEALMASSDIRQFQSEVTKNFIKWYEGKPKDIGMQCAAGIVALKAGQLPSVDVKGNTGAGNGGLMRALPCALFNSLECNELQCELTHPAAICLDAIKTYHKAIVSLVYSYEHRILPTSVECLEPTGYVVNTLNNAFYWASCDTFEECIVGAVNDGGDADTIAAITGSLAGARFGLKSIPERWIRTLNPNVVQFLTEFASFCLNSATIHSLY